MAYSSYGKKVYASIKDLPQYKSVGNGDKLIIWNETRDGAATVDFADLLIDLDHVSFKSTISEIVTLASDVQVFAHTVHEEVEGIQEALEELETTVNKELKSRIRALEYIIAIMLGSNSYWLSSAGLNNIRSKILIDGITQGTDDSSDDIDSEEGREALKWLNGLLSTVQGYISRMTPGISADDVLLQYKWRYKYSDVTVNSQTPSSPSLTPGTTTIETEDGDGNLTSKTTIKHS